MIRVSPKAKSAIINHTMQAMLAGFIGRAIESIFRNVKMKLLLKNNPQAAKEFAEYIKWANFHPITLSNRLPHERTRIYREYVQNRKVPYTDFPEFVRQYPVANKSRLKLDKKRIFKEYAKYINN